MVWFLKMVFRVLAELVVGSMALRFLAWLLKIPVWLLEDAIIRWINDQIAQAFDITSPSVRQVVNFIGGWAPYVAFAAVLLSGWIFALHKLRAPKPKSSQPSLPVSDDPPQNLTLIFDEQLPECRVEAVFNSVLPAIFFRIVVKNETPILQHKCQARLVSISTKDSFGSYIRTRFAENLQLTWALYTDAPDVVSADIRKGEKETLNGFFVTSENKVGAMTPYFAQPSTPEFSVLSTAGTYLLGFSVASDEAQAESIEIEFVWDGNWKSAKARRYLGTPASSPRVATIPVLREGELGPSYMGAYDVVHYLADQAKWGAEKEIERSPLGMRYNVLLESFVEFQRGAKEGGIFAIGRLGGQGQHVEIPSIYWHSATLDSQETLREGGRSKTSPTVLGGVPIYEDVQILASDVRRKWPHI